MPLVAQLPWGAGFCALFGQSFTALRASTLVLGFVGILAVHAAAREGGASRQVALVCGASVAANPVYLLLAATFMTDVPFFAAATASLVAFLRGLRRSSTAWIAVGTALSIAATLVRQFELVVPLGFAAASLVKNGARPRSLTIAALPLASPMARSRSSRGFSPRVLACQWRTGTPGGRSRSSSRTAPPTRSVTRWKQREWPRLRDCSVFPF
jgi:4-amino-4-deoxy-L-arabinose transferase-like glycosyltransferase